MDNVVNLSVETPTPEDADALAKLLLAWSDIVPTLYFLDSCSVSRIKDELVGRQQNEEKHKDHIKLLRTIDRQQHGVSCLLVLMEKSSDQTTMRSVGQMKEEGSRDRSSMEQFFSKARVVESPEVVDQFVATMHGTHSEELGDSYHAILTFASQLALHQPLAPSAKMPVVEKLLMEALRLGVSGGHPIIVTLIAIVYGCTAARKVVNFTQDPAKFKSSNALGDIQSLQRVESIFSLATSHGGFPYKKARLISDDLNLNVLGDILNITCESSDTSGDGISHVMGLKPNLSRLLPDIFNENVVMEGRSDELFMLTRMMLARPEAWGQVRAKLTGSNTKTG